MKLSTADREEITRRFRHHTPTDRVGEEMGHNRTRLENITLEIMEQIPGGPEATNFVTAMETALFWANAGLERRSQV